MKHIANHSNAIKQSLEIAAILTHCLRTPILMKINITCSNFNFNLQ